jgi:hypothetical protein
MDLAIADGSLLLRFSDVSQVGEEAWREGGRQALESCVKPADIVSPG